MWGDFGLFVLVGFAAQMVDGAIGMAYGVTGTAVLLGIGVPPATASACIHASEVFTTGVSGFSHWRFGNVRRDLIWRLALPGVVGGAVGAYVLATLPGETIRPYVAAYLLVMGLAIVWRALRRLPVRDETPRHVGALGLVGGFLDAIGGGGWGPVVTATLLGRGATPRYVIGSVNLAEFFVTATITGTFFLTIGLELWPIIAGLIVGGVMAAPLAAYATQRIPHRPMMLLVGLAVVVINLRGLAQSLG